MVEAVALAALLVTGCGGGGGGVAAGTEQTSSGGVIAPQADANAEIRSNALLLADQPLLATAAEIDDSGRVMVLYAQARGGRVALHAALARQGAAGAAPVFDAPEVVDAAAPMDAVSSEIRVALSPAGHAVALWTLTAQCTPGTYLTSGNCRYVVAARRLVGQGWETPVLVGDTPAALPKVIINDRGDVVLPWSTWRRDPSGASTAINGVVAMPGAAAAFGRPWLFDDIQVPDGGYVGLTLDGDGRMAYVTVSRNGGTTALVARRGNVASGFGATERLDSGAADVALDAVTGGLRGQVMVLWRQTVGGTTHRLAAALDDPALGWQASDLGLAGTGRRSLATITDAGDFLRYDLDACTAMRRIGRTWQAEAALPAGTCPSSASFVSALSRAGDLVGGLFDGQAPSGNTGQWLAYSAAQNRLVQALDTQAGGYLFGTASTLGGALLLAENGVAAIVSINSLQALPSAGAPAGTPGSAARLWLTTLRLR